MDFRKTASRCTTTEFDTLCRFWADAFGILGPEWMIILVLAEAGQGAELSEEIISKRLRRYVVANRANSQPLAGSPVSQGDLSPAPSLL